jgi:aldehyde dehydrogenase (NAD+)
MEISQLISLQKNFFNSNETKSVDFRLNQLRKLKRIVKENEQDLFTAIYNDFGKSEYETYLTELALFYHEINLLISKTRKWSSRKKVNSGLASFPARSYIIPEPLGATLVIGAWNYPYQLSLVPAATAIAAGNTVILKPSELPSNTSRILAKIINENFDENFFHVVEGGVDVTTELLQFPYDKIFFTGSIPVGKIVYQAAAKNLTPVTLELGGKSPVFVMSDCNLERTVQRIVWAKFINAGQTCVAPDYILVEKSIETKFLNELKLEIEKRFGSEAILKDNYTRIINERNFNRVLKLIDSGKVFMGGKTNLENRIITPTVLSNVSFEDEVMKDEIFGPVLPVLSFTSLDEIILKVKERPKPLSCYVYCNNKSKISKILREISFGGGAINDSLLHLSNSNLPFGGVGFSGIGSYHGKAGFDTFTHYKSILDNATWFEAPVKYLPYSKWKFKLLRWLFE